MKVAKDRSYIWSFCVLAVIGLAADQASKYGIFAWLYNDGTPREEQLFLGTFAVVSKVEGAEVPPRAPWATRELKLIPGTFDIVASHTQERVDEGSFLATLRTVSGAYQPYVNRGALFGWGNARAEGEDLNTLFAVVSFLAAAGITYWALRPASRRDRILCCALGLILAGTIGNFYDRIVFSGVRDFLHWYLWYDWPVFNIADSCLVCGAGLLLAHAFFTIEEEADQAAAHAAVEQPTAAQAEAQAEAPAACAEYAKPQASCPSAPAPVAPTNR